MNDKKRLLSEVPTDAELVLSGYTFYGETQRGSYVRSVLATCSRLRHKISVLNRRLLKVKAENRRLRKLLDGLKSIEIED